MSWDRRFTSHSVGTYAAVTVVALLIWFWAADETREQGSATFQISWTSSDEVRWVVDAPTDTVTVEMEGSRFALQLARSLKMPLVLTHGIELPSAAGLYNVSVVSLLDRHKPLRDTGVTVISSDPANIDVTISALMEETVAVQPVLPGINTEGDIIVEPAQATVRMSDVLHVLLADNYAVEAVVDPAGLEGVEPGRTYKMQAKLRLPAPLQDDTSVLITPAVASVEFTVRSRIKETLLSTVRVQIAGPPEDHEEYTVEIAEADRTLNDVTIRADGALIQQIEAGDVRVVALVHLSNNDKEHHIESKPVTYFLAIGPGNEATMVEAVINDSTDKPLIGLTITERERGTGGVE